MFFKNIAENLGPVPGYMVKDILAFKDDISTGADPRGVLGKGNAIQAFGKMSPNLQKTVSQLSGYLLSQQFAILKEMVVYESLFVTIPSSVSEIAMPTRYLCRAGELIIIPLQGNVTMNSSEFEQGMSMTVGNAYRINNRIPSSFYSSPDFVAAAFNFLDFDLRRYLMPHDISSPYARRKDEYVNPGQAPMEAETPQDAY
jgi:hypothetical protein